jgi:hypothetical protein
MRSERQRLVRSDTGCGIVAEPRNVGTSDRLLANCQSRLHFRMNVIRQLAAVSVAITCVLPGCTRGDHSADAETDQWLGQWNGPEGTFLRLEGGQGRYEITIQDLDGPETFHGVTTGNQIKFERRSVEEILHATNGAATGMKWLSEKTECLTIRPGEGYCRR